MEYTWEILGKTIRIETDPSLFSPKAPDQGTLHMLSHVELSPSDRVLDLGCGTGIVGIWAASQIGGDHVVMTDIDPKAVSISQKNLTRNEIEGTTVVLGPDVSSVPGKGFTWILSNPPYHTDFKVAKAFIEKGFNRLEIGAAWYLSPSGKNGTKIR